MKDNESDDVLGLFGDIYKKAIMSRQLAENEYRRDDLQMAKCAYVYNFLRSKVNTASEIDKVEFAVHGVHGGVTATFAKFEVRDEDMTAFNTMLSCASAISIDAANANGSVCISVTIPNIARRD